MKHRKGRICGGSTGGLAGVWPGPAAGLGPLCAGLRPAWRHGPVCRGSEKPPIPLMQGSASGRAPNICTGEARAHQHPLFCRLWRVALGDPPNACTPAQRRAPMHARSATTAPLQAPAAAASAPSASTKRRDQGVGVGWGVAEVRRDSQRGPERGQRDCRSGLVRFNAIELATTNSAMIHSCRITD